MDGRSSARTGLSSSLSEALLALCLPADNVTRKTQLISSLPKAPQHVVASAFTNHVTDYNAIPAAAGCRVPVAYIGAAIPIADLIQFRSLTPQLLTAQTLGSGHFSPLVVPDQINAMLSTFVKLYSLPSKDETPAPRSARTREVLSSIPLSASAE
jgi:hypothetical protein